MSKSLNLIQLIGNVGNDPEIRTVGSSRVATVSLATSRQWKEGDKPDKLQEKTEWHRLNIWGKLADVVEDYVKKGDRLYIAGQLEYRNWTDKDGHERWSAEIYVNQLIMLSPPPAKQEPERKRETSRSDNRR